jgi:hypothetical protein
LRALLIFPPGWMQFGPYLSLPLLKGYARSKGIDVDILDLNIEFYNWLLSPGTLRQVGELLEDRAQREIAGLPPVERARLSKAILTHEYLADQVTDAKAVIRDPLRYQDDETRDNAKRHLCGALGAVAAGFSGLTITPSEITFANCGLAPERVLPFLGSEANIITWFYRDRVRGLLGHTAYDFVGFSLPAWEQLVPTLTLLRAMRHDVAAGAHVCLGGNFTTRMVGTWNGRPHPFGRMIDSFSVFDGEESLFRLLVALDENAPLETVNNLVIQRGDALVRTAVTEVDITTIPTPVFDGLPLEDYLSPAPILPIYSSRSCPYKCSFCTIPYASSGFRQRRAELVVDDLDALSRRHRTRLFSFVDETLTVPMLRDCAGEINRRGLDLRWYGETRVHPKIDDMLCRDLFQAGCRKLQFGVESYNQRILNAMKKGVKLGAIASNLDACLSAGIAVHLFTFYGFPGEKEHEARRTHTFTQSVMARSREVYGNPYSSFGAGTFNLEAYSDVYKNPGRYGVQLTGESSFFEVDYRVEDGLTRAQAEALADDLNDISVFRDLCRTSGRIWWQALSGIETNEDESFLLYCLREAGSDPSATTAESAIADDVVQVNRHGKNRRTALRETTLVRDFPHDFGGWRDDVARPVTCFYDPRRDVFVNLDANTGRYLRHCLGRGRLPDRLDRNLGAAVNQLLRHRLIKVTGDGVVTASGKPHPDALLQWNPDVDVFKVRHDRLEFFNMVSQTLVSMDPGSALITTMVREQSMTPPQLRAKVGDELPSYPGPRLDALLENLTAQAVLLSIPGGRTGARSADPW